MEADLTSCELSTIPVIGHLYLLYGDVLQATHKQSLMETNLLYGFLQCEMYFLLYSMIKSHHVYVSSFLSLKGWLYILPGTSSWICNEPYMYKKVKQWKIKTIGLGLLLAKASNKNGFVEATGYITCT